MASLNPLTRELVFKVVFYGPGLGGKTTTLQHIHGATKPEHRGKLVSLATPTDRTLYFDFLPLRVQRIRNMNVRLQLFTVPGQVYYSATRKLVLTGADGIVFVADSQSARLEANQESLEDLNGNLAEHGRALSQLPHAFHWNKRDIADVVPLEELDRRFNLFGAPSSGTVATRGDGVFEGLEQITRVVVEAYKSELPKEGPRMILTESEEHGIAEAIRGMAASRAAASEPASTNSAETLAAPADIAKATRPQAPALDGAPDDDQPRLSMAQVEIRSDVADAAIGRDDPSSARASSASSSSHAPGASSASSSARGPSPDREASSSSHAPGASIPSSSARASVGSGGPSADSLSGALDASFASFGSIAVGASAALTRQPPSISQLVPTVTPPPASSASFTLAEMWPEADRESVRHAEQLLGARDATGAVLACDTLLTRILASSAGLAGSLDAPRDPGVVCMLLGLNGRDYLRFRRAVRSARQGDDVPFRDALDSFLFAVAARRARDRVDV